MSGALCRGNQLHPEGFQRALDLPDHVHCHSGIARGGVDIAMPEQVLDDANIDALLQQVRGEAMAQRVHGDIVVETRCIGGIAKGALHRPRRHRPRLIGAGTANVAGESGANNPEG